MQAGLDDGAGGEDHLGPVRVQPPPGNPLLLGGLEECSSNELEVFVFQMTCIFFIEDHSLEFSQAPQVAPGAHDGHWQGVVLGEQAGVQLKGHFPLQGVEQRLPLRGVFSRHQKADSAGIDGEVVQALLSLGEDDLRAPTPHVDQHIGLAPTVDVARHSRQHQGALYLARDNIDGEAKALGDGLGQLARVFGISKRARRHTEAVLHMVLQEQLAEVVKDAKGLIKSGLSEFSVLEGLLAKADAGALPQLWAYLCAYQQAHAVAPYIDGGDLGHRGDLKKSAGPVFAA